jgi:hypothetical protein
MEKRIVTKTQLICESEMTKLIAINETNTWYLNAIYKPGFIISCQRIQNT